MQHLLTGRFLFKSGLAPEGMNAEFIRMGLPQGDRLRRFNAIAIRQLQTLTVGSKPRQIGPAKEEHL